jgi:uncharacterized integral membrane protein
MEVTHESPERNADKSGRNIGHDARLILATILLVALVVFAVDNRRTTRIDWIVGNGSAPLAVLLAAAAIGGAVIGWLVLHRPRRRGSND